MAVTVYRSTDASAPTLAGTVGSLITVLDAILVNGYGAKAAAGWSKAHSGTNKAVYRNGAGASARMYLQVLDNLAAPMDAMVRGYETINDVDANVATGPFPTTGQVAAGAGLYWNKTNANSAATRPWIAIADDKTLIWLTYKSSDLGNNRWAFNYFGDIKSFKSGDAFGCLLAAGTAAGATTYNLCPAVVASLNPSAQTGHYMPRSHSQAGGSIPVAKQVDLTRHNNTSMGFGVAGTSCLAYPTPVDGGLQLSPVFVYEPGQSQRGYLRGVWNPCHNNVMAQDVQVSGGGTLTGKTFIGLFCYDGTNLCQIAVEDSNTWP